VTDWDLQVGILCAKLAVHKATSGMFFKKDASISKDAAARTQDPFGSATGASPNANGGEPSASAAKTNANPPANEEVQKTCNY